MRLNTAEIRAAAMELLEQEINRENIAREVERLRELRGRTRWQRFVAALPFTILITWKKNHVPR